MIFTDCCKPHRRRSPPTNVAAAFHSAHERGQGSRVDKRHGCEVYQHLHWCIGPLDQNFDLGGEMGVEAPAELDDGDLFMSVRSDIHCVPFHIFGLPWFHDYANGALDW